MFKQNIYSVILQNKPYFSTFINWRSNKLEKERSLKVPVKSPVYYFYIVLFHKEMVTTKICGLRASMHQNEDLEVKAPDILTTSILPGGLQQKPPVARITNS